MPALGDRDIFGDEFLDDLIGLATAEVDQDERAEAVVLGLVTYGLTSAVRWWEGGRPLTLAAAGPGMSAVSAPEPAEILEYVRRGEPLSISHVGESGNGTTVPAQEAWQRLLLAANLRSALHLPLWVGDEVRGVLSVFHHEPNALDDLDASRLSLVSHLVGLSLAAPARLLDEAGVVREDAEPLSEGDFPEDYRGAIEALHASREGGDIGHRAAEHVARLMDADDVIVARALPDGEGLDCYRHIERWATPTDACPVLRRVLEGEVIEGPVDPSADDALLAELRSGGIQMLFALPLRFQAQTFGALVIGYEDATDLTTRYRRMAESLAFHIALAIRDTSLLASRDDALARLRQAQTEALEGTKFRALAQMAGGVAHEFNNALGGILGRTQMLQRQTKDHRIQKGLRTILEIGWRAAETVRRLQEFTRERSEEDFQVIDVEDLWESLCAMARDRVAEFGKVSPARYHIELEHGDLGGTLLANPDELAEAVGNVLTNALEATPGGGVVMLHAHTDADQLHVTVVDRGRGMSEDEKQSIFDPFYSTKAETGVGLGLSVTYGIVSRHKGEIEVDSTPSVGTTVSVTVPLTGAADEEPEVDARPHLLVIDDEVALCEVLAELFTSVGYDVDTCAGGREGIDRILATRYDLVCTDLRTADVSGWEVIRAIKEQGHGTPVMLLTGFRDQLRQEQIEESGVDMVLGKPFTLQQVLDAVESLMGPAGAAGAAAE